MEKMGEMIVRIPKTATVISIAMSVVSLCFLVAGLIWPTTFYRYYQSLWYPDIFSTEREMRIETWLAARIAQNNVDIGGGRLRIFGSFCEVRLGAQLSLIKIVGKTVIADHRNDTVPDGELSDDFPNCPPRVRISLSVWEWDRILISYENYLQELEDQKALQDSLKG